MVYAPGGIGGDCQYSGETPPRLPQSRRSQAQGTRGGEETAHEGLKEARLPVTFAEESPSRLCIGPCAALPLPVPIYPGDNLNMVGPETPCPHKLRVVEMLHRVCFSLVVLLVAGAVVA